MSIPFIKSFDDFAENTANPPANRPLARAAGELGQSFCDALSARPGTLTPTFLQSPLKWACQPYWDSKGYDGPVSEPPFQGGQCVGAPYQVRGEAWNIISSSWTQIGNVNTTGPIRSIEFTKVGGPCSTGGFGPGQVVRMTVTGTDLGGNPIVGTYTSACTPINNSGTDTPYRLNSVVRTSGGADNCGNPPDEFKPGDNPAPDPGPLPPGTGPSFDIRGNPIIILPPTLEIAPDINIELAPGEFNFGGGTGGGPAEPPLPGEDSPGAGTGVGGGENDFDEPPDGERWAGCCVTITSSPPGAGSIPQAEPQSIYPRTVGNVRLRFAGADGVNEFDTPLVNRQKTTCVWEPVRGLRPTGVRVNLLPGYSYSYRPYSVPLEQ